MKPLIRDVFRLLLNPGVLLVLVALGAIEPVLSGALNYPPAPASSIGIATAYAYSGGYQIGVLLYDQAGHPVSGAKVIAMVALANSSGQPLASFSETTTTAGYAGFTWSHPMGNYTVTYDVASRYGTLSSTEPLADPAAGQLLAGGQALHIAELGDYVAIPYLLVAIAEPNGVAPAGASIWYNFSSPTGGQPVPGSLSYTRLAPLRGSPQSFLIPVNSSVSPDSLVSIEVLDGHGSVIGSATFHAFELNRTAAVETRSGVALVLALRQFAVYIALAALLVGYLGYARDRLSGAIEPVLALPVTRAEVLALRYLGSALALAIGVAVGTVSLGSSFGLTFAAPVPLYLYAAVWGGGMVIALATLGLVFLLSHLVRSVGTLLGGGAVLVGLFGVLWATLVAAIADALHVAPSAYLAESWQAEVSLYNPVGAGQAVMAQALVGLTPPGPISLLPVVPSAVEVVFAIVVWVLLPAIVAAVLARSRD